MTLSRQSLGRIDAATRPVVGTYRVSGTTGTGAQFQGNYVAANDAGTIGIFTLQSGTVTITESRRHYHVVASRGCSVAHHSVRQFCHPTKITTSFPLLHRDRALQPSLRASVTFRACRPHLGGWIDGPNS